MTRRKALGEFLQRALGRGTSQAQLARELGVSRSTVHLWASGKREAPERYRDSLRAAALGHKVTAPPPATTSGGTSVRHRGSVTKIPLSGGGTYIEAKAFAPFAAELGAVARSGAAPRGFTVVLQGFRAADSPIVKGRDRRIEVKNLTEDEIDALARGRRDAMEDLITRAVMATNYSGGFTYSRISKASFDAP